MKKISIEIKWAIIFVLMMLAWMFLEKLLGFYDRNIDKHAMFSNFIAIPAIIVYILALVDKRENYYGGVITYKQAFISGLIITLFVTVISPLTQIIVTKLIAPEYFPNVTRYAVNSGQMNQSAAESYFNLKSYIIQGLVGTPIMGIITAALVALFVKRSEKKTSHTSIH